MIKLSDYLAQYLADYGVRHIFMITGGGAMHLNDSFGHEPRLKYICNHHEQAAAMAAEGYARVTGKIGVINVTTGPGGVNALNGVFGAWTDSIPMLIVSGQVKRETCMASYNLPLRQLGDQEADIISMAKVITKYAVLVTDPNSIRYHLERALHLATSGRPGPCWLDIPIDIQSSRIDPEKLPGYDPAEDDPHYDLEALPDQCRDIIARIQASPRPVLLAGSGIHRAKALDIFDTVKNKLGIPVTLSRTARDLLASDDPLYSGRVGIDADRAGNFVAQNAETLLVLGSRLGLRSVSYNWQNFARQAFIIQVDADAAELAKPTVKANLPIHCDAKLFLDELNRQLDKNNRKPGHYADWQAWCRSRVERYPGVLPQHRSADGPLNPYAFCEALSHRLVADDVVACGNGSAFIVMFQAASVKKGQLLFFNSGCASMGYDLPAAVGAAVARAGKRVICLAGDGSIQLNIQELQTVAHHQLPIKIFVLNNAGYLSIRQTQLGFFGNLVGADPTSGVTFPDMVKVAQAYAIPAVRIEKRNFPSAIDQALSTPGPVLCDVILDPNQEFEPKTASKQLPDGRIVSPPLEDMYPFLDRDEFMSNMIIPAQET